MTNPDPRWSADICDAAVDRAMTSFQQAVNSMVSCKRCNGTGYHHGFGEHGHDPDWCEVCGGCQSVPEFNDREAMCLAIKAALSGAVAQTVSIRAIADDCRVASSIYRGRTTQNLAADSVAEIYSRIAESIDLALASQPPAAPVETEAAKTCNSYLQRALDAEADALRLHNEKMAMYERAIEAEAKLAAHNSSSAENDYCNLCGSSNGHRLECVKIQRDYIDQPQRGQEYEVAPWPNGTDKMTPRALRYLAEHNRPPGGNMPFNSEHLHQLADEIELMAKLQLYRKKIGTAPTASPLSRPHREGA